MNDQLDMQRSLYIMTDDKTILSVRVMTEEEADAANTELHRETCKLRWMPVSPDLPVDPSIQVLVVHLRGDE